MECPYKENYPYKKIMLVVTVTVAMSFDDHMMVMALAQSSMGLHILGS